MRSFSFTACGPTALLLTVTESAITEFFAFRSNLFTKPRAFLHLKVLSPFRLTQALEPQ